MKKLLSRYGYLKTHPRLRLLHKYLHNPLLWHFNRRSISRALAIVGIIGFIPLPTQMLFSAICAIVFRANLPLAIIGVWFSNPLTLIPIYYGCYHVGLLVLQPTTPIESFHWTLSSINIHLSQILLPTLVGTCIVALITSISAYVLTRLFWRHWVLHRYKHRHDKK